MSARAPQDAPEAASEAASEAAPETAPVLVIGGGPAGLAAAEAAAAVGARAILVDKMPTLGRKFLMAGKSGLNLTNAAPWDDFLAAYGDDADRLSPILAAFDGAAVRAWADGLGQQTFVGSGGKVFPRALKASPLLRAWRARLDGAGATLRTRWRWVGLSRFGAGWLCRFETPEGARRVAARSVVLALGGASWPRLGSDGAWAPLLAPYAALAPFAPSNMGFEIAWSDAFAARAVGRPLKDVAVSAPGLSARRGDLMVAKHGLEGGPLYALSAALRARCDPIRGVEIRLDLAPGRSEAALAAAFDAAPGKASTATRLRKAARLTGAKAALLREAGPPPRDPAALAARVKNAPLRLTGPRPIAEAISTAGGVSWRALDADLMIRDAPGLFVAGEMIDWDAPTGGYLLSACIASGRWAGAAAARRATAEAPGGQIG